jgi:hypothetical protein
MRLSVIAVVATVGVFSAGCGGGALREECGDADKTYVHITNRAA